MEANVTITPDVLAVQPGGAADSEVRVRNTSTIVEQYSFEALGPAASWVTFQPSTLSLFPDGEGTVRAFVRPPRGPETPAGTCPVGVWVRSQEDPSNSVVEELTVEVGQLVDTFAELIPRTSRNARAALHTVAVDNRGNTRLNAALSAKDPDDRLRFQFDPESLTAEAGGSGFAKVWVRPLKRFLRGPDVNHPFEVYLKPDGQAPIAVPGTMIQQAIIPRWVPRAVAAVLALALIGAGFWLAALKPVVKTTAKAVAKDTAAEAIRESAAENRKILAEVAKNAAAGGGGGAPPGQGAPTPAPAPGAPTPAQQASNPFDTRLEATPTKQTVAFPIPAGQRLSLTDIVLQNPQGDSGLLRIERGTVTLLAVRLENFRDLDYHFVTPVVFKPGEALSMKVECANAPPNQTGPCTPAAYFTGTMQAQTA